MNAVANKDVIKKITTHYIDAAFVESHGREVMDIINPTNSEVIARVTLGDAEDAQRAIAAARRALVDFGRTTKEERSNILRRLHEAAVPPYSLLIRSVRSPRRAETVAVGKSIMRDG